MTRVCDNCKEREGKKFWITGVFVCDDCYLDWKRKFDELRKIKIEETKNKNTIFGW